jgi:hypothetical protein
VLGPADYLLWFGSALFEGAVVVCSIRCRSFFKYLPLNLCMLADLLVSAGRFLILHRYGFASSEYVYFYYYSDALATILLYFSVMCLYQLVFEQMGVSKYLRGASILLLCGTALFSYLVVNQHTTQLTSRFVLELSQNLYFVGVVLTYLLWGAVMKLRETRTRLIQLVLSLGIFFSGSAGAYALRNLVSGMEVAKFIPPLMGTFLALAWAYTFLKVPEEARLATARVAAPNR